MRNINSQTPLKNHKYNKYSKKAKTESNISNAVNIPSQLRNAITQGKNKNAKGKVNTKRSPRPRKMSISPIRDRT